MKKFFYRDKTGRGITNTFTTADLLMWEDEEDDNGKLLHDFASDAEDGDKWVTRKRID